MDPFFAWILAALTLATLTGYELFYRLCGPVQTRSLSRLAHASLREDWLEAMGSESHLEIVAIQTLRNSMMSSTLTLTASTAALGLLVSVTLATASIRLINGDVASPAMTPRLLMDIAMVGMLLVAITCSTLSVRYFNHTSFIVSMPAGSPQRQRWRDTGKLYLHRAGVLYGWALRALLTVGPLAAFIIHPLAGPPAAAALVMGLRVFDRVGHI